MIFVFVLPILIPGSRIKYFFTTVYKGTTWQPVFLKVSDFTFLVGRNVNFGVFKKKKNSGSKLQTFSFRWGVSMYLGSHDEPGHPTFENILTRATPMNRTYLIGTVHSGYTYGT